MDPEAGVDAKDEHRPVAGGKKGRRLQDGLELGGGERNSSGHAGEVSRRSRPTDGLLARPVRQPR